ncbi:MAG: FAD-dependent oxidoreductase [Armatimonadetes bacterium]|nr:FAD-dependent oxidoreductase [Armatimonadota bacterium]MDE2207099.1 FAD-dependent oxidoreductase [Armatimonadota bacterium]
MKALPKVLILGGNFAGLTAARFIHERCGESVEVTLVDRKADLLFIPNIGMEVLEDRDPAETMRFDIVPFLDHDGTRFVRAQVTEIDLAKQCVRAIPTERPGSATETLRYDYLVIALGARLAFDHIEGFAEYGHAVTDSWYGNKLRAFLHGGSYRGGPVFIGSARFHQGTRGNPDWLPLSGAACDGPPLETALSLAAWLEHRRLGGPKNITVFSPANVIAEDAGQPIVKEFLEMAGGMGFHYERDTPDIASVAEGGITFTNGKSVEAELKILLPDWRPHDFIRDLPIVDEAGFIITDRLMRNPQYREVFALGDAAALTVPKLGALGHTQAEIVARQLAMETGQLSSEEAAKPYWPQIVCFGDMGRHKAFYIHSDVWYGGSTSIFKMGYMLYAMKLAFKEMYFRTGGKVPGWGLPVSEVLADSIL